MYRQRHRTSFLVLFSAVVAGGTQALAANSDSNSPSAATPSAAQSLRGAIAAEVRADRAERDRLIEQALHAAPDFAPARWQSGQVRYDDQWLSVDAALEKSSQDELLAQYRKLRSAYGTSPEGQLTLARWCDKHHLDAQARAHASQLLAARSDDPEVLKMLDLVWHNGQLITTAELADRKARDEKAKQAMQHWRPLIGAIRGKIDSKSSSEREQGRKELEAIRDPAAIEALIAVLKNRPALLCDAIGVIGQIPGQEATDALLQQAMLSKNDAVILAACRQLKSRSMYAYVPKLMAALSTPLQTKLEVVRDAEGVHFRETLQREDGEGTTVKTVDTEVGLLVPNPNLGNIIGRVYSETFLDAQAASDATAKVNRRLREFNDSIYGVLEKTVGSVASREPGAWWDWWRNYTLTSSNTKPVYVDNYYNPVPVPYVPYIPSDVATIAVVPAPLILPPGPTHPPHSCFARGTKVWTLEGPAPIENVQIGDQVLSQSPLSGELTFKPVLDVTLGQQEFIALTTTEDQRLVSTPGHVFWVSGAGWRMTKEIKVGDRLHTVSGWSEVKSAEPVEAGETHNLVVADFNTYFVGNDRVLTHDVTMPQASFGGVPGEIAAADR